MCKKITATFLFTFIFLSLQAFHLIGVEINVSHLDGNLYQFRLVQFLDAHQSQNETYDTEVTLYLFSQSQGELIQPITLPLVDIQPILYQNENCSLNEHQVEYSIYSDTVTLDADLFHEEQGYYAVWERCCRNIEITNIEGHGVTGITSHCEFPGLKKNNTDFINSSPIIDLPVSDYACVNKPFKISFEAYDPDGDSLGYSLVTPLNSSSSDPVPLPTPKPWYQVLWAEGYSQDMMIPTSSGFTISGKGLIQLTPTQTGLYLYSVKVTEYRNGEAIGAVTRDYQLLVQSDCPALSGETPHSWIAKSGSKDYGKNLNQYFEPDESRCFDLKVSGVSQTNPNLSIVFRDNSSHQLDLSAASFNEKSRSGDTTIYEVCFPYCEVIDGERFQLMILAKNDDCPQPLTDTTFFNFEVAPWNSAPTLIQYDFADTLKIETVEDSTITISLQAEDKEGDQVTMTMVDLDNYGVDLADYGLSLVADANQSNAYNLSWSTACGTFDYASHNELLIGLALDDLDTCNIQWNSVLKVHLKVNISDKCMPQVITKANKILSFEIISAQTDGIVCNTPIGSPQNCTIYDLSGKLVYSKVVNPKNTLIELNTRLQSDKVYIVKVGNQTRKVFISCN